MRLVTYQSVIRYVPEKYHPSHGNEKVVYSLGPSQATASKGRFRTVISTTQSKMLYGDVVRLPSLLPECYVRFRTITRLYFEVWHNN